jgi:hypothetical protein
MLSVTSYGHEYIEAARKKIDDQVGAYGAVAAAGARLRGAEKEEFDASMRDFEVVFFNNMVLVLENHFVHRTRALEKKDGNPLNEVRLLCTSMMSNDGRLVADKQIKLKPETSVLGYTVGDEIQVREADFRRLADGFFAEIEAKFL